MFYILAFTLLNVFLFILMGVDKYKAKHHLWRVPECVLIGLSLIGGGLGGMLGAKIFHHKTQKFYFWLSWFFGTLVLLTVFIYLFPIKG
jgi:uncharacterized membrane protein YsdA (DUF1294 family)